MNEIPSTTCVPDRYRQPWDRPKDTEWVAKFNAAKKTIESDGIILLIGDRGTGKTRVCAEIIRDRYPVPAHYTTAMTIFLRIREAYAKRSPDSESQIVDELSKTWLLVIDEIQERSNSEWEDRIITHIIDRRYGAMKPTIIVGNLTPESMKENLGESIVSRVSETGGVIKFTGQSFRQPKTRKPLTGADLGI